MGTRLARSMAAFLGNSGLHDAEGIYGEDSTPSGFPLGRIGGIRFNRDGCTDVWLPAGHGTFPLPQGHERPAAS
jgi:hypothetical protein